MNNRISRPTDEVADCPIYKTMALFQGKWNVWVLFELEKNATMRFGELKRAIPGISNTMLAATLKGLEEQGLVRREQFNEIPPHVEYSAAEPARALRRVFAEMAKWGETYLK